MTESVLTRPIFAKLRQSRLETRADRIRAQGRIPALTGEPYEIEPFEGWDLARMTPPAENRYLDTAFTDQIKF
jgi:hypothetical protein